VRPCFVFVQSVLLFVLWTLTTVRAMRVVNGVDLRFALAPPSVFAALLARVVAALTAPLHRLAGKLVYPKVGLYKLRGGTSRIQLDPALLTAWFLQPLSL
jgi:hypothetical protein